MKWESYRIEELCLKVTSGGTPLRSISEYYNGGTIPWIKTKEVNFNRIYNADEKITEKGLDNSSAKLIPENSILIAMYGDGNTAGRCAINRLPVTTNQACCNLEINPEMANSDYMFYKISTLYEIFKGLKSGGSQQNLNAKTLKEFKLSIPPLPTQHKIASILSAYDDLIENNLRRIKLLEEKAFLSYKGILRSEKLEEGRIGDLASVKSGFAFKSRDWVQDGFPVIKIKNIGDNDIDFSDCSFIPESIADTASKFILNVGDLLIAMTGATVGKIGMMPKTETNFYLNQRVGIFNPKILNSELFLFCFFNEPSSMNAIQNLASGAAQPNISGGQIEGIKLFHPGAENISRFGEAVKPHFELILNLKSQNAKLREARDILLPRLMSGEIVV
jgi:type I restriction enzyme S subunit